MNEAAIIRYITETFPGTRQVGANGDSFFMLTDDDMFPFATLVRSNFNDTYSDLDRPGIYRLNVGVGRDTFRSLFGTYRADGEYDYTALDRIMPHPEYGTMYWLCVLNPSDATFEDVKPLLAESYALAVQRNEKHASRT